MASRALLSETQHDARLISCRDDSVKGFAGNWSFYRPDSAEDEAVNSSFRCLRTYETLDTNPITIKFRTFNQLEPGNGTAKARPQDGVFESDHSRLATDPFFSVGPVPHVLAGAGRWTSNASQGQHWPLDRRCLGTWLCLQLNEGHRKGGGGVGQAYVASSTKLCKGIHTCCCAGFVKVGSRHEGDRGCQCRTA